jgi:Tol biopolymer transport system component
LDNADRDVYMVDADTGTIINLTPNSRKHEISPMWTLDGAKIVFLSTASSSRYNNCELKGDAPHQLRLVNADGSGASVVYEPEFYYASVSVSNSGQVLFVANMTSMTAYDYSLPSTENGSLYRIDLAGEGLIEMLAVGEGGNEIIIAPSWSPNEDYLAYRHFARLRILDVRTGKVHEPLEQPSVDSFVWSPDSQRIAVTTSTWEDMARDSEEHIHVFDVQGGTFQPLIQE